jgi:hypothetical protein
MSTLLEQASLIMIPSGYKEDVVYSVIPENGNGDLSFTRASNGTRVNSAGLVEVVPWNLLEYSEDLSNGVWVKTNTTVSTNTTTAPNGTTTADSLLETTANATHQLWQRPVMVAGQTFTQSCYIKTNGRNRVQLQIFDNSALYVGALFDVVSGTIIATNGTSSIESVGNGWYRCIVSGVCPTSTTGYCVVNLATDSYNQSSATDSYTGDASKGIFIWGFQLNIGSTAKPYFPTTDRLNVPRLTYQNGGGGCPSLLLEKQSTNLIKWSEQFDNAGWTKENLSVSANNGISPDGTQNADKLIADTVNTDHTIYQSDAIFSGASLSFTTYAKANGYNYIFLGSNNNVASDGVFFNLTNGTISQNTSGLGASIQSVGNGWYRCVVTASFFPSIYAIICLSENGTSLGFAGDNSKGVLVWGAQLETSSYPTSYIPTTSASATRVADACFKTGISSLIGQTEGTMFVDVAEESPNEDGRYMFISDASFTNRIVIYQASGSINVYCSAAGGFNLTYSPPAGRLKIAFVYKSNDYALWVNGVVRTATVVSAVPSGLNAMGISSNEGSIGTPQPLDTSVNQAILFPTRLTNAELASLTTL